MGTSFSLIPSSLQFYETEAAKKKNGSCESRLSRGTLSSSVASPVDFLSKGPPPFIRRVGRSTILIYGRGLETQN